MAEPTPHPSNVPGDFYVEDGCCTMCEVPLLEAPDLFGGFEPDAEEAHCYVKRQPGTAGELDRMILTIRMAEADCIHYRGSDRSIQNRLKAAGEWRICDHLAPDLLPLLPRWWQRFRRWIGRA